jgi:hypothetical protein
MEPKLMAAHGPARSAGADAQAVVTALYQVHAVGLAIMAMPAASEGSVTVVPSN